MAFSLEQLRVVCLKCPAEATLLLVELEAYQDSILIWCECHGEHVLGTVDGRVIKANRFRDPQTNTVNLTMQSLRGMSREDVIERHAETERLVAMATKRLEAFNHYLSAPQQAKPEVDATRLSERPCTTCGVHHELERFRIDQAVRVLAHRGTPSESRVGMVGVVREWSQMGGPIYVRVQFEQLDEYGDAVRENFDPCMLEAVH